MARTKILFNHLLEHALEAKNILEDVPLETIIIEEVLPD